MKKLLPAPVMLLTTMICSAETINVLLQKLGERMNVQPVTLEVNVSTTTFNDLAKAIYANNVYRHYAKGHKIEEFRWSRGNYSHGVDSSTLEQAGIDPYYHGVITAILD